MENVNSIWQIAIFALLAGVMIGILAYRLFGRSTRESEKIQTDLDAARDELDRYKTDVNEHFHKTSELVNDLTQNYVRVYQHLAEGAHTLGDAGKFDNLLQQHPGKVSLTVDGESPAPNPGAGDRIVEAPAAAQSAAENAAKVTDETAVEAPPAEPSDAGAASPAKASPDEPGSPAESPEPALEAGDFDETDGKVEEIKADTGSMMAEDDDKSKTGRTVH